MTSSEKYSRMANAIRFLSMDAVEKANSGHPGLPLGAADVATVLFSRYLKFDPKNPLWPDRDRFVLSAGHGSMLLYSLLYLTGYEDMTIEDIKQFRQLGSKTAGHPEYGHASGIETTTGPLGQGVANAVGMAIAEKKLEQEFGSDLQSHFTYALVGDGCLMEGISQEAIALAGHLKLNKLVVFWDNNSITIDGAVSLSDSTDQIARFKAVHWNTIEVDGHDQDAIAAAIEQAHKSDRPTFIACKTIIGFGAPNKQGTHKVHGNPLGAEEIAAARKHLNWDAEAFSVPADVLDAWREAGQRSAGARKAWEDRLAAAPADIRAEFVRRFAGDLPEGFDAAIDAFKKKVAENNPTVATRKASEDVLEVINGLLPETLGGSADLTPSNNTKTSQMHSISPTDFSGRYMHWGIREHATAAAINGIALHGGLIPYSGGFLIFSDYCRPSVRLAALMGIRVVHVWTHDSIGVGEDGPTHQPVEHLASLRAIPGLLLFRPADETETAESWQLALNNKHRPSGLALTRQNLTPVRKTYEQKNLTAQGAYELVSAADAKVSIFASGSEVELAVKAAETLSAKGVATRVVSVPCVELFFEQSDEYRKSVIGTAPVKIAVEAAVREGWDAFIGSDGVFVGMKSFGASGPAKDLFKHFGITVDAVVAAAEAKL
ncbi:transketolase [Rhizobium oryzicola]|uniref:Transketolase n=1 Tax=Rhizobium oryzicola TaxID=1232668 RepID=A0ABT8SUA8_9HYPH|nr:transketolase [Rhizobium oryzicola]MDO1582032.1 transketolase [Rhizobium oryzicola]